MTPANPLADIVSSMMAADPSVQPELDAPEQNSGSSIQREIPDPAVERRALVNQWSDRAVRAYEYWDKRAFAQMRRDQRFAAGEQWQRDTNQNAAADHMELAPEDRYTANIVLRHIHQRTSTIYGKNPKVIARRRARMMNSVWDGTMQSLQQAVQGAQPQIDPMTGQPQINPLTGQPVIDPQALAILQDFQQAKDASAQLDKIARTLELVYEYEVNEQAVPFKQQMKATVRRTLTNCVAYVKIGYQRVMARSPEVERQIQDYSNRLALVEQLSADVADGISAEDSAEAERLRLAMDALSKEPEIIVREGLTFSYPDSTMIVPAIETRQLRGFVGAPFVAEVFFLTPDQIKQTYSVDVTGGMTTTGGGAKFFSQDERGAYKASEGRSSDGAAKQNDCCRVFEIYCREDGMVYVVCEGYPDFLVEPGPPDVKLERFYPWFSLVFNETETPNTIFPVSDVSLMRHMQNEINRAREGLRQHRIANRPRTIARAGVLEEQDKANLSTAAAHSVVELNGLMPQEKVEDVLQPYKGAPIDGALYDTNQSYEDILRVVGQQEANLGGTSGATATEVSTAEGSRISSVSSNVDDLDELMTELARAGGQILLAEMSAEAVKEIAGPGAVWPDLNSEQIAKEIYLEVEAASTGRPNKGQEVQNAQQLMPLLLQVPGVSPEWIARELIRRMDDRIDPTEAFMAGTPSIASLNRTPMGAPGVPGDPNSQGAAGGNNNPDPAPAQVNAAPRPANPESMPAPSG